MLRVAPAVADALAGNRAVVALESALISHGLPAPLNLQTIREAETAVRERGAVPAVIGIVGGRPAIGLMPEEVEVFSRRTGIVKTNLSNLAWVITRQAWGSTTVSASIALAHRGGVRVFATGGVGGVHRNVNESFDISSDLEALARTPMVVVSSGAKSVLDLEKTFEMLETLGIPVVGFRTREFPAFFARASRIQLEASVESAEEVARLASTHWNLSNRTGVLVAVPPPPEVALSRDEADRAIDAALEEAAAQSISGRELTPFLLDVIDRLTEGRSRAANVALIVHNAGVAAEIAACLTRGSDAQTRES